MPVTSSQTVVYTFKESTVNTLAFSGVAVFEMKLNGEYIRDISIEMAQQDIIDIYGAQPAGPTRFEDMANAYYLWAVAKGHLNGLIE